jgi:hypothetical protein
MAMASISTESSRSVGIVTDLSRSVQPLSFLALAVITIFSASTLGRIKHPWLDGLQDFTNSSIRDRSSFGYGVAHLTLHAFLRASSAWKSLILGHLAPDVSAGRV